MKQPARLERAGVLNFRDRIWSAIRLFGLNESFSVAEISVLSGERVEATHDYLRGLNLAHFVTPEARPPLVRTRQLRLRRFVLIRDTGVDAPQVYRDGKPITRGIGHERMWNAMRKQRCDFTWREIALQASTEDRSIAMHVVKDYLKLVGRAGYLRTVAPAHSTRAARYVFIQARNTGPRPPLVLTDKSVQDGNTGEIVLKGANG